MPHWKAAMDDEIRALYTNDTWELTERPSNTNVIRSKWIYKTKLKEDGTIERFKARLVAQGYTQVEGIDFNETFSPVIKHTTIRLILALAVSKNWTLRQLDVQNALLHGDLKEEVYMSQPPGYIDRNFHNHVCKLKKSIYRLKQAPQAWFDHLSHYLVSPCFVCCIYDPSLFILKQDSNIAFMSVYVDDIILTDTNPSFLTKLIASLSTEFTLKDLGDLHFFLGVEVQSTPQGRHLIQVNYTK